MTLSAPTQPSRRIAVFGSLAAEGPLPPDRDQSFSPAARAVLERVLESVAANAASIAKPILDRAVEDGTITRAERHAMLLELGESAASADALAGRQTASQGARRALRDALAAVRRAAPGIARPILDEAVEAERLTPAQERRILERLRASPAQVLRGALHERTASAAPRA